MGGSSIQSTADSLKLIVEEGEEDVSEVVEEVLVLTNGGEVVGPTELTTEIWKLKSTVGDIVQEFEAMTRDFNKTVQILLTRAYQTIDGESSPELNAHFQDSCQFQTLAPLLSSFTKVINFFFLVKVTRVRQRIQFWRTASTNLLKRWTDQDSREVYRIDAGESMEDSLSQFFAGWGLSVDLHKVINHRIVNAWEEVKKKLKKELSEMDVKIRKRKAELAAQLKAKEIDVPSSADEYDYEDEDQN